MNFARMVRAEKWHNELSTKACLMCIHNGRDSAKYWLDRHLRRSAKRVSRYKRQYWRLVHAVRSRSQLLTPTSVWDAYACAQATRVICACVRIAQHSDAWHPDQWHRAPEQWCPPEGSAHAQLTSLVQHLFEMYPVPEFLTAIWWSERSEYWERDLYLHLARGAGVRRFQWPFELRITKSIARWFVSAPPGMLPFQALRWAQVHALGGDDQLARIIATCTRLREPLDEEPFWETVLRFLIRNMPLSRIEIILIVIFIHCQRFQPGELIWGPGGGSEPLQPEFSLRGRTLMSLRRHMANWRDDVRPRLPPPDQRKSWEPTTISGFEIAHDDEVWTIGELLTDRALFVEGNNMQHCVAEFIDECARRETSIWSMKVCREEIRRRVLTIEVDPESKIVKQAQGKRNSDPSPAARRILRQWAEQEQLNLSELA